jgi:beta-glucosidase
MIHRRIAISIMALGLSAGLTLADWTKIDDFQSTSQGRLERDANGWRCFNDKITTVTICSDELAPGNLAAKIHHGDDGIEPNGNYKHDVLSHHGAVNIPPGGVATIYLRFLVESGLDKTLGHVRGVEPVEPVRIGIALSEKPTFSSVDQRAGVFLEGKEARIVGLGRTRRSDQKEPTPQVKRNRWYRLWLVIHNAPGSEENKSRAYLEEEGGEGKKIAVSGFLVGEKNYKPAIWKMIGVVKYPNCALTDLFVDDFYVDNSGENLTQPVSADQTQAWREKLQEEASKYAHLLKRADTRELAEKQGRELLAAMTPDERFELVTGYLGGVPRLGIPPVLHNDAGSGINNGGPSNPVRARLPRTVAYPCTLALAATWNTKTAEAYGRSIGEECRRGGTAILLGPGMNLYRSSVGGRNFEYFGEDPLLAGRQVEAYVRGMQGAGTAATLKHFIGNECEFHRRGSNSQIDERTLREVYMEPFRLGIEAGARCVMTAYNQINGEWAGQSKYVNTDLLRGALGFKGIIMTDWIATYDATEFAASGADLEMPFGTSMTREREKLLGSPAIDRMVLSFLTTCIQAGFFDRPAMAPKLEKNRSQWEETARAANLEGITLLKNNSILPLTADFKGKRIIVAGNRAKTAELAGEGSGHVQGYNLKTYLQAVSETFVGAEILKGDTLTDEQIRSADLVLVFPGMREGEGCDRSFVLPDDQLISRCVTNNPKTVVCLVTGGGVQMEWADKAAAIVHAYFGGQTGASALMDILLGRAEPAGRLPFTIERRVEDAPGGTLKDLQKPDKAIAYEIAKVCVPGDLFLNDDKTLGYVWDNPYTEGVVVGHRWYESRNIPVRYPFGFGLGYTTFSYEDLKAEVKGQKVKISFLLKNTGKRSGSEVAQVYVSDKACSVPRPPQELKAFEKVRLGAGKSKRVELELGAEAFRFWNPATKQWTVEPGEFEIRVGASSSDIRLKATVQLSTI